MTTYHKTGLLGLGAALLAVSSLTPSYALDASEAADLVKRYSETVACQLEPHVYYEGMQYSVAKLTPNYEGYEETDARYVVFWEGDLGCSGGEASRMMNFSIVIPGLFENLPPVVSTYMEFPDIDMIQLTAFEEQDGKLHLEGLTFGDEDTDPVEPSKAVAYTIELMDGMLMVAQ